MLSIQLEILIISVLYISLIHNENLWKNKLLQKGGDYKLWANAPSDYNLN